MKEVSKGLKFFRVNHGLESNEGNLLANINDEITELLRANGDSEVIGELCDIYIYAHNALHQNGYSIDHHFNTTHRVDRPVIIPEVVGYMWRMMSGMAIGNISKFHVLNDLCEDVIFALRTMGYDPEKCVLEKIKVINSRTGEMDLTINKWVKHTTEEAKSKWYTADFMGCEL